jgi:Mn-dependent DtxR family transcriptional regulator
MRVFENKLLSKILGLKRDEVTGELRRLYMRSLMACTPYQILFW